MSGQDDPKMWSLADDRLNRDGSEMYSEVLRSCTDRLDSQRKRLESMRSKVISLLGFVGAATGFMVAATLTTVRQRAAAGKASEGFFTLASWATITSAAAILSAVFVLVSMQFRGGIGPAKWEFDLPLRAMMAWIDRGRWTLGRFRRAMVSECIGMIERNEARLRQVQATFTVFIVLIVLQLVLWGTVIWRHG